jgi:hypothetical protein
LPKGLNPFLNSSKLQIGFVLEVYNAKSRGIFAKGNLFHLNFPTTMQRLGIFGLKEDGVF